MIVLLSETLGEGKEGNRIARNIICNYNLLSKLFLCLTEDRAIGPFLMFILQIKMIKAMKANSVKVMMQVESKH